MAGDWYTVAITGLLPRGHLGPVARRQSVLMTLEEAVPCELVLESYLGTIPNTSYKQRGKVWPIYDSLRFGKSVTI